MLTVKLDASDAAELAELLQFVHDWLAADQDNVEVSQFEDEEHRRFVPQRVHRHVADLEKTLGIYDLAQFTPPT